MGWFKVAQKGFGLGEVAKSEAQMFSFSVEPVNLTNQCW